MTRIDAKFEELSARGKKAFVSYIMAGDPDFETALEVMQGLPSAAHAKPTVRPRRTPLCAPTPH